MRKLATIARIENLEPIPNADRILKATVRGWECVVSKSDNFNVGDKVIFVEVDSILPPRPEFAFMKDRKYRVRTIKLRKQISQGLVLPLSYLRGSYHEIGDDVTKELGITKYDPQAEAETKLIKQSVSYPRFLRFLMKYRWFRKLLAKFKTTNASFPVDICNKTDEERVQNLPNQYGKWHKDNVKFYMTEKLDGCSATYFLNEGKFGVCSRNVWLRKEDDSPYWEVARRFGLKDCLRDIAKTYNANKVVIQGEIIGKSIQGNKYHVSGYDFFVYNVIIDDLRIEQDKASFICKKLGLNNVPVLTNDFMLPPTIHDIVEKARGKSLLYDIDREGIVVRNYREDISFKVINPDFLLKNNE